MKRTKRAITIMLVVMLLAQLFAVGAAAGGDVFYSPFSVVWSRTVTADGVCLSATIYDESSGEQAEEWLIEAYNPYILISRCDMENDPEYGEYTRVYFSSATATVSIADAGKYDACVTDDVTGFDASELGDDPYCFFHYIFSCTATSEADELYMVYISELEGSLSAAGITGQSDIVAAVSEDPDFAVSLYYFTMDIENALAEIGAQSLGEYLQTYESGRYSALYEYLIEYDGDYDDGGDVVYAPVFADVPVGAWYEEYVNIAFDIGLIYGKGEGIFAPDDNMTIAEAITLSVRFDAFFKGTEPAVGASDGGPWYQPYVDYAEDSGLPWQYGDYNAKITRNEFAHIFAAVYQANKSEYDAVGIAAINTVADGAIPDVPMGSGYADDIYTLYRLGVLGGSDAVRNFRPDSNIQRSEVSAILCRMIDIDRQEFTL